MKFQVHIPFVEELGFELLRFEPDRAEIAVTLREALTNSWGVAHGGVTMTLLDVTMAHAARSPGRADDDATTSGIVTVEMKTSFLRPGLGRLVARATRLHRTRSLAFCEGSVSGADGAIVAHATGTFKFVRELTSGDGKIPRQHASD